jgi:hypothetical protein
MSYFGQDADDARTGMDNFVANLQRNQANQDAMLQGYRDQQHDTNMRVLESSAMIVGGVAAYNAYRNSSGETAGQAVRSFFRGLFGRA